jgi:dihydroorotase
MINLLLKNLFRANKLKTVVNAVLDYRQLVSNIKQTNDTNQPKGVGDLRIFMKIGEHVAKHGVPLKNHLEVKRTCIGVDQQ